jgi:hypothetical protein
MSTAKYLVITEDGKMIQKFRYNDLIQLLHTLDLRYIIDNNWDMHLEFNGEEHPINYNAINF